MMLIRPFYAIALGAASALIAGASSAAPANLSHECAAIPRPEERLACYDRAFPLAVDQATVDALRQADFGLSGEDARSGGVQLAAPDEPDRIEATVTGLSERRDGVRVFVLDNGQTWTQTQGSLLGRVQPGDRVTIKQAAFSSYQLITPGGVALRVRRVK